MDIQTRMKRMREFCFNPHIDLGDMTPFERVYVNSIRDHGREPALLDYTDFPRLSLQVKRLTDFRDRRNIILYTGGKESLLTKKILEFFDVPYMTINVAETFQYEPEKKIVSGVDDYLKQGKLDVDRVFESHVVSMLDTGTWGKHIPTLYCHAMSIMQIYPGCVVWIGSEYTPAMMRYAMRRSYATDQSDILFRELNDDPDVPGEVYSCVNSLQEIDIYRIVRKSFGYDPSMSYYDQGSAKRQRIEIWEKYISLLDDIDAAEDPGYIKAQLHNLIFGIRLMHPVCYDFRESVAKFILSLKEFAVQ